MGNHMNGTSESKPEPDKAEREPVNLDDLSWYLLEKLRAEFVLGRSEDE